MLAARSTFVSEEEFLALPESMNKVELLDGEVVAMPAPSLWHQETLRRLLRELGNWAATIPGPVLVGQSPVDIRFAPGRIVHPADACVFLARIALDTGGPIDRVPGLCIEVLSTNRVYDRVTKRLIYADAGVVEYWVVDPSRCIERWTGEGLSHREEVLDRLRSALLPGFALDVPALFAE